MEHANIVCYGLVQYSTVGYILTTEKVAPLAPTAVISKIP